MTINSQAKGKRAERDLANWWKVNGFPDAARAVKTGDRFTPDAGDLILEHLDFRLVVEVKHHAGGLTEGRVAAYGEKLIRQVAQSRGTMGVLVERRDRVSDPGKWWVHMAPAHFAHLELAAELSTSFLRKVLRDSGYMWVSGSPRTTVDRFAAQLRGARLAAPLTAVASSAMSAPDGPAPEAVRLSTAIGGT